MLYPRASSKYISVCGVSVDSAEIESRVNAVFREVFDDPSISVTPDMSADDIDDWDSLNHTRLIVAMEMEFDVRFGIAEIGDLQNVGEFMDLLTVKLSS